MKWNDPASGDRINALQKWIKEVAPTLAGARDKLQRPVAANPNLAITWGDEISEP